MPPPMVTCSVCNKEVLKAQTYFVGEGKRACKVHEGVIDKKEQLAIEAVAKREQEIKDKEAEEKRKRQERESYGENALKPCCWKCRKTGIREQDYWASMLIASEKLKLKGEDKLNPFSAEYHIKMRRAMGIKDDESPALISILKIEPNNPFLKKLHRDMRPLVDLIGGHVAVCQECMKEHGLERPVPKVDLDFAMTAYAIMQPVIRKEAQKSLDNEAQRN